MRERLVRELPALAALGLADSAAATRDLLRSWVAASGGGGEAAAGIVAELTGAGPLDRLLADERVTEIMVNGPAHVHVEVDGRLLPTDIRFRDEHHLRAVIDRLVAEAGRRIDDCVPTVDAVLPDGSRLNAVLPPVAVAGPLLTIRRARRRPLDLGALVRGGAVSPALAVFLHAAVLGRCTIVVSGGAGAGKTTLLGALVQLVPDEQRVVTIEDVAELRIEHPHVVAQQCRPAPTDDGASVDMRALVRNTLRMRPDRIVVGEVRGAEAADMVAAMNTGHAGSMSTVHANSAAAALSRLEALVGLAWPAMSVLTLRSWITEAVDVVVHCERRPDGSRAVTDVVAVDGRELATIFTYDGSVEGGRLHRPPERCLARMARHGVDFSIAPVLRPHIA
jgi:pilus assembly protein CpaF